jgi:hypothetical protein
MHETWELEAVNLPSNVYEEILTKFSNIILFNFLENFSHLMVHCIKDRIVTETHHVAWHTAQNETWQDWFEICAIFLNWCFRPERERERDSSITGAPLQSRLQQFLPHCCHMTVAKLLPWGLVILSKTGAIRWKTSLIACHIKIAVTLHSLWLQEIHSHMGLLFFLINVFLLWSHPTQYLDSMKERPWENDSN